MTEVTEVKKEKSTNHRKLFETLWYPVDLDSQPFYPESIKFTVYKRHGASLKAIQDEIGAVGQKIARAALGKEELKDRLKALRAQQKALNAERVVDNVELGKVITEIGQLRELQSGEGSKNLAGVLLESKGNFRKIFAQGSAGLRQKSILTLQKETTSQLGEIYLNMPNEIAFNDEASWEGTNLGMVGGLAKGEEGAGGAAIAGFFSNFSNVIGGGTGALTSMLLKLPGGALGGGIIGSLGGEALQKGLESGTGQIANPYKEMTFSGIGFRNFSFNFVFRARSQTEVTQVQKIIQTFRYYSKPTYNNNVNGAGFLNYPQEFHIEFLTKVEPNDNYKTNSYIPQIKMCVCKGVTTNFSTQNTWKSLKDGAPVEISLGLTFEETELVTGEDVIGETKIGRFKNSQGTF